MPKRGQAKVALLIRARPPASTTRSTTLRFIFCLPSLILLTHILRALPRAALRSPETHGMRRAIRSLNL
jgi:hypothetical protein